MNQDCTSLTVTGLAELLTFPPALLRGLPLATVLTVRLPGDLEAGFVVVGDVSEVAHVGRIGVATFGSDEIEALACAVEYGRADSVDVVGWVARKRSDPSFRLDLPTALQGVAVPDARTFHPGWTLGRVLREVRAVIVDGAVLTPAQSVFPLAA